MRIRFCISILALVSLAAQAPAAVITFEGHPDDGNGVQTQDGYTFEFSANGWGIFTDGFVGGGAPYTQNGTTRLTLGGGSPGQVLMSQTNSNPFSLQSFDAAVMFPGFSGTIDITGNLNGGGTVLASVNVVDTFGPFSLTGFNNLSSVLFAESVSGGFRATSGFALDNLTVDQPGAIVPEPAAAGLIALSLGALAVLRRRRMS